MGYFLKITFVLMFGLSFANASSMSSISVNGIDHVVFTCISDRETEIELYSAELSFSESQESRRFIIGGHIRQASHPVKNWIKSTVHFIMDIESKRDEFSVVRLISHITMLNPFIGEREDLNQSTISYVEFHLLKDRLHEPGSTGFTSESPSYGFGVQCFFSGI